MTKAYSDYFTLSRLQEKISDPVQFHLKAHPEYTQQLIDYYSHPSSVGVTDVNLSTKIIGIVPAKAGVPLVFGFGEEYLGDQTCGYYKNHWRWDCDRGGQWTVDYYHSDSKYDHARLHMANAGHGMLLFFRDANGLKLYRAWSHNQRHTQYHIPIENVQSVELTHEHIMSVLETVRNSKFPCKVNLTGRMLTPEILTILTDIRIQKDTNLFELIIDSDSLAVLKQFEQLNHKVVDLQTTLETTNAKIISEQQMFEEKFSISKETLETLQQENLKQSAQHLVETASLGRQVAELTKALDREKRAHHDNRLLREQDIQRLLHKTATLENELNEANKKMLLLEEDIATGREALLMMADAHQTELETQEVLFEQQRNTAHELAAYRLHELVCLYSEHLRSNTPNPIIMAYIQDQLTRACLDMTAPHYDAIRYAQLENLSMIGLNEEKFIGSIEDHLREHGVIFEVKALIDKIEKLDRVSTTAHETESLFLAIDRLLTDFRAGYLDPATSDALNEWVDADTIRQTYNNQRALMITDAVNLFIFDDNRDGLSDKETEIISNAKFKAISALPSMVKKRPPAVMNQRLSADTLDILFDENPSLFAQATLTAMTGTSLSQTPSSIDEFIHQAVQEKLTDLKEKVLSCNPAVRPFSLYSQGSPVLFGQRCDKLNNADSFVLIQDATSAEITNVLVPTT